MTALIISAHAVERYQERVANLPLEQVREALSCTAIAKAVEFGAPYVRLGTGQRVVLQGSTVVTVLPAGTRPTYFDRRFRETRHG